MVWKAPADQERDSQDVVEKHVYGSLSFTSTGAQVSVNGNGTTDTEIPVLHTGQLHNLAANTDAEVFVIGNGSDTTLKMAIVTGPRDKQYQSNPGESWGQDPIDPKTRVGYTPNGVRWAADPDLKKTIAEALTGMFEIDIKNNCIYFRCPVIFQIAPTVGTPPPFKK